MVIGKLQHLNKGMFLVVLIIALLTKSTDEKPNIPIRKIDISNLSNGDLIFRKGRDLVSSLILSQGRSAQFSHVGIIVKNGDIISVIHSLPETTKLVSGVQMELLSSFISFDNASDIAVYRLKGIDNRVRQKVTEYSLQQIGKPFDSYFLLSTDTHIYCTELAIKAYASANIKFKRLVPINIMMIDELVIPPDHLRQSESLDNIKI